MKIPDLEGIIGRRLLINFRCAPDRIQSLLPAPFRCQQVDSWAVAGICLLRLEAIRPKGLPAIVGLASENAAHRIAVEWDQDGRLHYGVYIARRDTSSQINAWAGGRLFPGEHHLARIESQEGPTAINLQMASRDHQVAISVAGRVTADWPQDSIFSSFAEANDFFRVGCLGYSPCETPGLFQGMQLECPLWQAEPFAVESVNSSFFNDSDLFPDGTAQFDCALLMRNVPHQWHSAGDLVSQKTNKPSSRPLN